MEGTVGSGGSLYSGGSGVQQFMLRDKRELIKQGKRNNFEWDLNDWRWDADLFIATPLQPQSNNSDEKRRRVEEEGNLTLKLSAGGPIDGKKSKICIAKDVSVSYQTPSCQVENCGADLSVAKDYHRRHKVCEIHSKASKALVGNAFQRFCQQCSRFQLLQEFDGEKKSCRRRLAGHNRRRRKTHPEAATPSTQDLSNNYLLISLLRILSNMHSNNSDQAKDQDILSHLLKNLASYGGAIDGRNVSGVIQEPKEAVSIEEPAPSSSKQNYVPSGHETSKHLCSTSQITKVSGSQLRAVNQTLNSGTEAPKKGVAVNNYVDGVVQTLPFRRKDCSQVEMCTLDSSVGRTKLNNIDLNSAYSDSEGDERPENAHLPLSLGTCSPNFSLFMQKDSHQLSPPQTSLNSDSLSGQSPSSSSGDAQSRTDRIVFKLFGKDPNHFPVGLRSQILNWLSHSPTDIEGYIRPGCIVLTIYLRLAEATWQELQDDLRSNLGRLLDISDDSFWKTGWVYTRVQHQIAFIYNGQIVLDTVLPLVSHSHSRIASVTPIAVSVSERAQFFVKGYNLSRPTARVLCALEGKYLLQQATNDLLNTCPSEERDIQCLSFPCSVPDSSGRGFLEVEDDGLSSGFFPFIVAEEDICLEIRMLESALEVSDFTDDSPGFADKMELKNQALDFIHEMGWLLRRSRMRAKLVDADFKSDIFSFTRFRWLLEFSLDQEWRAVVKKLLDLLFDGDVGSTEGFPVELALLKIGLLHRAVRKRSRLMVEFLIKYVPDKGSDVAGSEPKETVRSGSHGFLFRPDAVGPAGLTPLHIAASIDGSDTLLDALTDDPGLVGVAAWKTVRDNTGLTPEDYARIRGHYSYILLIHKKMNKKTATEHVIVDIPGVPSDCNSNQKQTDKLKSAKVTGFEIGKLEIRPMKMKQSCKVCDQQFSYGNTRRVLMYRPAVLSILAVAAVCVCVSLLFKSYPEVVFIDSFRWEDLAYGPR